MNAGYWFFIGYLAGMAAMLAAPSLIRLADRWFERRGDR